NLFFTCYSTRSSPSTVYWSDPEISSLLAIVQDPVHQQFTGPTQKLIMSTNEQTPLSQPTSAVQNTLRKEQIPQDLDRPAFDAALREYCDRNYHQLLPILAEKVHQEKVQQEKLKAVKACLNFEEVSQHSESRTPSRKRTSRKGLDLDSSRVDTEKAATRVLAQGKQSLLLKNVITKEHPHEGWKRCQKVKILQEDTRSQNQSGRSRALRMICPNRRGGWTKGPMIIEAEMGGHFVHRMYVNEGSSSKIMYEHCFNRFRLEVRSQMVLATTPLVGFSREIIWLLGQISLLVKIERPGIRIIQAIPSTAHGMIKFPVTGGTVTLRSSRIIPLMHNGFRTRSATTQEGRKELCGLLRRNLDIFAWKPADMTRVSCHIAEHRLNIREGCLPVRQKKMGQAPERNKAIYEVEKLVDLKNVCRFQELKQSMPQGWLSATINRLEGRVLLLKNTGATYQHLVDKAFQKQIGRNLKVYVDDLVVKSRTEQEVIRDIEETFKTLREINIKLNPKKYTFGMREGMFLGYKVNAGGLKVCPNKVEAVLSLPSPKCLKDMQKLNGKLASLNRFLSKSAEKSLPFFKTLKKCTKKSDFQWTGKAKTTFKQMKKLIAKLPMLTAPKEKEELVIYMAAAKEAIRRLLKQRFELEEHDIHYRPTTSVKGRILADFIVERPEDDPPDTPMEDKEELSDPWILFDATNNEAEYEALIAGLRIAEQMRVKNLQANVDSRLVANQVNRTYIAKEPSMIKYLEKVKNLTSTFKEFSIKQVPRGENKNTDALSKMASTSFSHLSKQVLVEELKEKSIDEKKVLAVVEEEGRTWMTPIYEYLTEEILPEEKWEARAIRRKAGRYAHARRSKIRGDKSSKIRILLAKYARIDQKIDKGVQKLSGSPPRAKEPAAELDPHHIPLAILQMEDRYSWTLPGRSRFGLLGEIISDNGKQFRDNPFKDWCEKLCIRQCFTSVKHPQANGLVERENRSLGEGIKARLDERSKNWLEEISHVLWVHRTMIKSSNGEMPFSLAYGTEAVIPVEIGMPTLRTAG
nr:hypothetical protein [Tanacetum cinerariifolium]